MKSSISRNIIIIMAMALGALLINAAIPLNALHQLDKSHTETEIIREKITIMDSVMQDLLDAQNSVRGYAISDNPEFLEPFYKARSGLDSQLKLLQRHYRAPVRDHNNFLELRTMVAAVLSHLEEQIQTQQTQGSEATIALIARGEGKRRMDEVRDVYDEVREMEDNRLDILETHERKIQLYTNSALIGLTIFDLVLFVLAFKLLFNALRNARRTEKELSELHAETLKRGEVLTLKNKHKTIQARLNDVLQSVITPEEAYAAIQKHCAHLFPDYPGALYIRSNSRDYFELKASWNGENPSPGFEPDECWAARNNQIYEYNVEYDDLPCKHVKTHKEEVMYFICLPISSRDEMIGTMNILGPVSAEYGQSPIDPEVRKLAHEVVGQIGLAIANLRLRDSLRKSSIVDALTGLYNRRYLDETLPREIARAQRSGQSVGVIMLDIDHFKMFNDNYGHDAGDVALRETGMLLKQVCRSSDIPCRFGGEEFIIILPQATLEISAARADAIRWEIKKLHLTYGSESLPAITASLGIAAYPIHGERYEDVIKAADGALYHAKHQGRDRVEVAPDPSAQEVDSHRKL